MAFVDEKKTLYDIIMKQYKKDMAMIEVIGYSMNTIK